MGIYSAIFNHTLGPVTVGPSSSNTSALYRIGKLIYQLVKGVPKNVVVKLATTTSFARTYLGMKSDLAFINGLLGKDITAVDFNDAYKHASKAGLSILFDTKSWAGTGTVKGCKIEIISKTDDKFNIIADSTGGGTIALLEINGCPVKIEGDYYELLIFTKKNPEIKLKQILTLFLQKNIHADSAYCSKGNKNLSIIEFKKNIPFDENLIQILNSEAEVVNFFTLDPVYPVIIDKKAIPPFIYADEMVAYADRNNYELWQAAINYEKSLSSWTEKQVFNYAKKLWKTSLNSIKKGIKSNFNINGIVTPKAKEIFENLKTNKSSIKTFPMGILDIAVPISLGIMEFSNGSGVVVCTPTGGSCGIVPAAIYSAGLYLKSDNDSMVKAFLAAGVIGICMAEDNTFSGGKLGCQAEIGCGAAMAAGALVQMLGGSPKQSCDAASMALQSLLGLVCDPVAGLVQVPCLARNMSAAAIAVVAANTVMAGFNAVIPLEDMCIVLKEVGKIVSPCKGIGATTTRTGSRLAKEQQEWEKNSRLLKK